VVFWAQVTLGGNILLSRILQFLMSETKMDDQFDLISTLFFWVTKSAQTGRFYQSIVEGIKKSSVYFIAAYCIAKRPFEKSWEVLSILCFFFFLNSMLSVDRQESF
jgi:hypothetical protein